MKHPVIALVRETEAGQKHLTWFLKIHQKISFSDISLDHGAAAVSYEPARIR